MFLLTVVLKCASIAQLKQKHKDYPLHFLSEDLLKFGWLLLEWGLLCSHDSLAAMLVLTSKPSWGRS